MLCSQPNTHPPASPAMGQRTPRVRPSPALVTPPFRQSGLRPRPALGSRRPRVAADGAAIPLPLPLPLPLPVRPAISLAVVSLPKIVAATMRVPVPIPAPLRLPVATTIAVAVAAVPVAMARRVLVATLAAVPAKDAVGDYDDDAALARAGGGSKAPGRASTPTAPVEDRERRRGTRCDGFAPSRHDIHSHLLSDRP